MPSRSDRRQEKRRSRAARQPARQPHPPAPAAPAQRQAAKREGLFDRISTDWIIGGLIGGVVVIAALVFLFGQILSGGGSSRPFFNQIFGVAVSPANPNIRLLGDVSGLYRSTNGGSDWDLVAAKGQAVYSVVSEPADPNGFVAVGNSFARRSDDGGKTWRDFATGLPSLKLRALAIDPAAGRTWYAFVDQDGLYRSNDGGQTWSRASEVTDATITTLAVKAGKPDTVYAFNTRRGLVRSNDGGQTFDAVGGGVPSSSVTSVLTHAQAPETVFAIAARTSTTGTGRAVYRSTDDGASWKESSQGIDTNIQLVALARDSSTGELYAADAGGNFYVSADGGGTWSSVSASGSRQNGR